MNLDVSEVRRISVTLYGSLALIGRGHGTDRGVMLGLMGFIPATADPDLANSAIDRLEQSETINIADALQLRFVASEDIIWEPRRTMPVHPNACCFAR